MSDLLILKAFQKSVIALMHENTFITSMGGYALNEPPIKILGQSFVVPNSQKYIELVHIPNNREVCWGEEEFFQGIFRIILHWSNNNEGVYKPLEVIDLIKNYYPKSKTLRNGEIELKVIKKPNYNGMIEKEQEMLFTTSIEYRSFKI